MGIKASLQSVLKYHPPSNPYYHKIFSQNRHTDADFFKIIYVNPESIVRCSTRTVEKYSNIGEVWPGDWDIKGEVYRKASFYEEIDTSFHHSLEQHFRDGQSWQNTLFVQEVIEQIENGSRCWSCETRKQVEKKCAKVDRIYQSIQNEGYATHKNSFENKLEFPKSLIIPLVKRTALAMDEVTVDISRSGELLFYDGKHRLSIAKIIGLDTIPVRVGVRHSRWQKVRDEIRDGNSTDTQTHQKFEYHPDLRDIQ